MVVDMKMPVMMMNGIHDLIDTSIVCYLGLADVHTGLQELQESRHVKTGER
jgi:hypothetical protein